MHMFPCNAANLTCLADRFLRIEVLTAEMEEGVFCAENSRCFADTSSNQKHQREVAGRETTVNIMGSSTEQILLYENHVSSALLAGKSPFFFKLFSNGMRESNQRYVALQIDASEEAAFMDLLKFMENSTLTATTLSALLDVLKAADKFEVPSCLQHCSDLLIDMPMTLESAVNYLELPPSVQIGAAIHSLVDAAKRFLAAAYKDIKRYKDKICCLSLAGLEAVLSSDDLQVSSEDALYDTVLEWAKVHYPIPEERRKILTSTLGCYIRFPHMSFQRLKKILFSNDFDNEFAYRVVLEALIFKAEAPYCQRTLASEESISTSRRFLERAYKYRPIKVVKFDHPCLQRVVYLDLNQQECKALYPSREIRSQPFQLGGQVFFLSASCNLNERCSAHFFGLFLGSPSSVKKAFISLMAYSISGLKLLSGGDTNGT